MIRVSKADLKILGLSRKAKLVTAALFLTGVLAIVPYAAHSQDQSGFPPTTGAFAGVVVSSQNPLQIALLHWYQANLVTQFPAGTGPYGVVFDGANIWVANNGSNKVTKIRPSDGATLGSFATGGTNPLAVAYDGANV
jgi:DNA-binding beta-propeller fold protein YncE